MKTVRDEIAIERFHEILAHKPSPGLKYAAELAVEQADALISALYPLSASAYSVIPVHDAKSARSGLQGCRACFGSGGKKGQPCKICGGSGKVAVTVPA